VVRMGRWGDGEIGRLGDGEMGRWGDGEMGRLGDWEMGRLNNERILYNRILYDLIFDYQTPLGRLTPPQYEIQLMVNLHPKQ